MANKFDNRMVKGKKPHLTPFTPDQIERIERVTTTHLLSVGESQETYYIQEERRRIRAELLK